MATVTSGSEMRATSGEAQSAARLVIVLILIGTALRLALSAATGLGMDESYSVGSARQFLLSFQSHFHFSSVPIPGVPMGLHH